MADNKGDCSPSQFDSVIVSPGRSPAKGIRLTGTPRQVKDLSADLHNYIDKWQNFNDDGASFVSRIVEAKINPGPSDNTSDHELTPLDEAFGGLQAILKKMEPIVSKLVSIKKMFKGICELEMYQDSPDRVEPLFQTLSTESYYDASSRIAEEYQNEYNLKAKIVQHVAHQKERDMAFFYASLWLHQPYITDESTVLLECLLKETGHR